MAVASVTSNGTVPRNGEVTVETYVTPVVYVTADDLSDGGGRAVVILTPAEARHLAHLLNSAADSIGA